MRDRVARPGPAALLRPWRGGVTATRVTFTGAPRFTGAGFAAASGAASSNTVSASGSAARERQRATEGSHAHNLIQSGDGWRGSRSGSAASPGPSSSSTCSASRPATGSANCCTRSARSPSGRCVAGVVAGDRADIAGGARLVRDPARGAARRPRLLPADPRLLRGRRRPQHLPAGQPRHLGDAADVHGPVRRGDADDGALGDGRREDPLLGLQRRPLPLPLLQRQRLLRDQARLPRRPRRAWSS